MPIEAARTKSIAKVTPIFCVAPLMIEDFKLTHFPARISLRLGSVWTGLNWLKDPDLRCSLVFLVSALFFRKAESQKYCHAQTHAHLFVVYKHARQKEANYINPICGTGSRNIPLRHWFGVRSDFTSTATNSALQQVYRGGASWMAENLALSSSLRWIIGSFRLCTLLSHSEANSEIAGSMAGQNPKGLYQVLPILFTFYHESLSQRVVLSNSFLPAKPRFSQKCFGNSLYNPYCWVM